MNNKQKKEITTIKLSKDTANALNELKIHPRQSYEEVILEMLKLRTKKGDKKA
jgi:hypothetical protein